MMLCGGNGNVGYCLVFLILFGWVLIFFVVVGVNFGWYVLECGVIVLCVVCVGWLVGCFSLLGVCVFV